MDVESSVSKQKRPYRRFKLQDLEDVAALAAKRLTDTQACQHLGINYFSFKTWVSKNRHEAKFADILSRTRAAQLVDAIENIEDAAKGKGVHQKADWRASKALLDFKFPELINGRNHADASESRTRQQGLYSGFSVTQNTEPVNV